MIQTITITFLPVGLLLLFGQSRSSRTHQGTHLLVQSDHVPWTPGCGLANFQHVFGSGRTLPGQTLWRHQTRHGDVRWRSGCTARAQTEGGPETWHSPLPAATKCLLDQFRLGLGIYPPETALAGLLLTPRYLQQKQVITKFETFPRSP